MVLRNSTEELHELRTHIEELESQLVRLEAAEEQVLGARAQAQALLDNIPHMAWMKNVEGIFLAVNEPFARASGYAKHEILGKTDHDIWPAELAERYQADDRKVVDTGTKFFIEEPIAEASGTKWFETFKAPIRDTKGRVTGTVGLAQDITERKHAEEQRQLLHERMQQVQKLESLGVLAGGIAHDFNNLLMGVLANAELALKEPGASSKPLRECLQGIRDAALSAAELTNQMLAYSGRGHFVVRPVSMNDMVRDVRHLLTASISKKARVEYELADDLPYVMADVAQLHQVVMNLITNASDALGDGAGTIRIRTGTEHVKGTVENLYGPTPLTPGKYIYLEVVDDGCGIDEDTRARVFEPFFTTRFTGRGLGLSTVQGIVRGHEGGIVLRSELEKGTTIKVLLRQTDAAPVLPATGEREKQRMWPPGALALVVDDDQRVREVTGLLLRSIGFEVLTAGSGREAIESFESRGDDLLFVLLDLTMPDLNGDQVLVEMRRRRQDIPVILSSGYSEHEMRDRFGTTNAASFLQKPYRFEALQERLHEIISSAHSSAGTNR